MTLYTKSGDDGSTGLFGGDRVPKDDPRVEAYGTVDELNACLGLAAVAAGGAAPLMSRFREIFGAIQSRLFDLGADLATPTDSPHADKIARIVDAHVSEVEAWIDEIDAANAAMTHFVLPGGTELAARLHLARTVCRRAERAIVTLRATQSVSDPALIYINRVGDLLFAMARRANASLGVTDIPWIPHSPK